MTQTTLTSLQNQVIQLEKRIVRLTDNLEHQKAEKREAQILLKYYKKHIEDIIARTINETTKELQKRIEELEKENITLKQILNHTSENSGIPTSKTPIGKEKRIPNSREKSDKTIGGQIGHEKHKLEKFKDNEITETRTYKVTPQRCNECGEKLKLVGKRSKDEFEIKIRLEKIRHEFCCYECPCCGKKINTPIPDKLKEENQYGTNAQAIAVSIINEGMVSFKRTRELISGFTGGEMSMSEGFLVKLQKRCYQKLENWDKELHQELLKQKVINWDDTVIAINGKQACLRFYGTSNLAYYKAHEKKNKEGLDEDGILKYLDKNTVVVHDHNKVNYNDDYEFTNAECCVHLIRDLKALNESLPREWITNLIELLVTTNNKRKKFINQNILYFDQEVSDGVIAEYDRILKLAKEINKKDFNRYYGSDEKKLITRLETYKQNYLLWVLRFDVPFSNNLSERSLRSSKTKMKVSGQFANISNAEYFARIKSYIETCKRNGVNSHSALQRLLEDKPYSLEELKITKNN